MYLIKHCKNSPDTIPTIYAVGIVFSATAVLLITVCSYLQSKNLLPGLAATELILFLVTVSALFIRKYDWKETFRIKKARPLVFLLSVFCALVAMPLAGILNLLGVLIVKLVFGRADLMQLPAASSIESLLLQVIVIAGMPAVCEELLFRGFLQKGLERFGAAFSVIGTGLLFGLFHMDMTRFVGTAFLGMLIGFVAYRTNSIFPGMVMHFSNNLISVLFLFFSHSLQQVASSQLSYTDPFSSVSGMSIFLLMFFYLIYAVILGGMLIGFLVPLIKLTDKPAQIQKAAFRWKGFLFFLPGFFCVILIYIYQAIGFSA